MIVDGKEAVEIKLIGVGKEAEEAVRLLREKFLIFEWVTEAREVAAQRALDYAFFNYTEFNSDKLYLKAERLDYMVDFYVGLERIKQVI